MSKYSLLISILLTLCLRDVEQNILIYGSDKYLIKITQDSFSVLRYNGDDIPLINGKKYGYYDNRFRRSYEKYKCEKYLRLKNDSLYYKDDIVQTLNNVKIRNIWQSIKYSNHIILLCRTSLSDKAAEDKKRPFFATELAIFSTKTKKIEQFYWVDFNPPNNRGILVLR